MKKLTVLTLAMLISVSSFGWPYVESKMGPFITNDFAMMEPVNIEQEFETVSSPEAFFTQTFALSNEAPFGPFHDTHALGIADWLDFDIIDPADNCFYRLDYEATDVYSYPVTTSYSTNWVTMTNGYYDAHTNWIEYTWPVPDPEEPITTNRVTNTVHSGVDVDYSLMATTDLTKGFTQEMFTLSTNYTPSAWSNRLESQYLTNNRKLIVKTTQPYDYVALVRYSHYNPNRWPDDPWTYRGENSQLLFNPQAVQFRVVEYLVDLKRLHNFNTPEAWLEDGDGLPDEKWADIYYRTSNDGPWIYSHYASDCKVETWEYLFQLETRHVPLAVEIIDIQY